VGAVTHGKEIMLANWKTVRVFISSTFRDMQAERDHLVRFVFPRLREQLLPRRIHLVDVDLRWGAFRLRNCECGLRIEKCMEPDSSPTTTRRWTSASSRSKNPGHSSSASLASVTAPCPKALTS